jgi:hypothetical protein
VLNKNSSCIAHILALYFLALFIFVIGIYRSGILFYFLCLCAVLKLLKMAKAVRALLDTVMQALPEVGNLGLLFFLLFFIFAALGVELFGRVGNGSLCCFT